MKVLDLFIQNGTKVLIEGNKPQILKDDSYVWMVGKGKISIFLTNLTNENMIGVKNFLFEAEQGDLLFGITPEGSPAKCIMASGLVGSHLLRLEVKQLNGLLLEEETSEEAAALVARWLKALANVCKGDDTVQGEIAATEEKLLHGHVYLNYPTFMKHYHSKVLQVAFELWQKQNLIEKQRLQEKISFDRRLMANSISKLASINQKEKTISLEEVSGDNLLDACRLVGKAMNIDIVPPPANNPSSHSIIQVDDVARASRIRTREVALNGEWYKQDGGPILGYMEEDSRPIALIPASPKKYIIHDFTMGVKKVVDKETAAKNKTFWLYILSSI